MLIFQNGLEAKLKNENEKLAEMRVFLCLFSSVFAQISVVNCGNIYYLYIKY